MIHSDCVILIKKNCIKMRFECNLSKRRILDDEQQSKSLLEGENLLTVLKRQEYEEKNQYLLSY